MPRTVATRSLDSVSLYVSLLLRFPTSIPALCNSRVNHSSTLPHSAPLDPLAPLDSSTPEPESKSKSDSVAASSALFFDSSKPIPACSHYRIDTLATSCRVERSQRSRIGLVAIYCATVFCLLGKNFLKPLNTYTPIASYNGG